MSDSQETAKKAGFDLSLIEENLRLNPEERLQQHQRALNMLEQLQSVHRANLKHQGNDQSQH